MRSSLPGAALLGVLLTGCATTQDYADVLNRDWFNQAMQRCNTDHSCRDIGDLLSGQDFRTRQSDWQELKDRELARRVYEFGCERGDGDSCRRLFELRLGRTLKERERYRDLLFYSGGERTPDEIQEEEEMEQEAAREGQARIDQEKAQEASSGIDVLSIIAAVAPVATQLIGVAAQAASAGNAAKVMAAAARAHPVAPSHSGLASPGAAPNGEAGRNRLAKAEARNEAIQQNQQAQQARVEQLAQAQQNKTQALQQAKRTLDACLATDVNCDDGTSDLCHPAGPYGDRWGERGSFLQALGALKLCSPAETDPLSLAPNAWGRSAPNGPNDCKAKVFQALPDTDALAQRLATFERHVQGLAPQLSGQCPGPSPDPGTSEDVRQVRSWCNNTAKDCATSLQTAHDVLEKARQIDSCLWEAETHWERAKLKQAHDADCQKHYDDAVQAASVNPS